MRRPGVVGAAVVAQNRGSHDRVDAFAALRRHYASATIPGVYTIAGPLNPGAVGDQIGRGDHVVELLVRAGRIGLRQRLLVVGGGAAGVAAAFRAARMRVPVTLLERQDADAAGDPTSALFGRQAHCTSRRLEPTGYLWPAPEWAADVFPIDGSDHDLRFTADVASNVSAGWNQSLTGYRAGLRAIGQADRFLIRPGADVSSDDGVERVRGRWHVTLASGERLGPFGAIVMAVGAGGERDAIGPFRSVRFWDDDRFDTAGLGCGAAGADVVISGGGDGAVQDAVRFLVRPAFRPVRALLDQLDVPPEVLPLIPAGRDVGGRDCPSLRRLDEDCKRAAERYVARRGTAAVSRLLRPDRPRVHFLHRCDHIPQAYPLNRFVLHLLHCVARQDSWYNPFLILRGGQELTSVVCQSHAAGPAPMCLGLRHHVETSRPSRCALPAASQVRVLLPATMKVVLLRHGADPSTLHPWAERSPPRRPRPAAPASRRPGRAGPR